MISYVIKKTITLHVENGSKTKNIKSMLSRWEKIIITLVLKNKKNVFKCM